MIYWYTDSSFKKQKFICIKILCWHKFAHLSANYCLTDTMPYGLKKKINNKWRHAESPFILYSGWTDSFVCRDQI